jgi:hypothetical protein
MIVRLLLNIPGEKRYPRVILPRDAIDLPHARLLCMAYRPYKNWRMVGFFYHGMFYLPERS